MKVRLVASSLLGQSEGAYGESLSRSTTYLFEFLSVLSTIEKVSSFFPDSLVLEIADGRPSLQNYAQQSADV